MSSRIKVNSAILLLLFSCLAASMSQSEAKSIFAIGTRILNDQLLVKDVIQAKPLSMYETPAVVFSYSVPQPITFIEILSEANVLAEVNFSYYDDLVNGTVKSKILNVEEDLLSLSFDVQISIFGFNETVLNLPPNTLINRQILYKGDMEIMEPVIEDGQYIYGDEQYETVHKFDDLIISNNSNAQNFDIEENVDSESMGEEDLVVENQNILTENLSHKNEDKIIEIGNRQLNDQLLYENFQVSSNASVVPTQHNVVFYFIDSVFITCVQFIIYGYYSGKAIQSMEYRPPVGEYSHFSPNSFKASITDFNTTSLFVHMFVFGYNPDELTSDYVPFLRSSTQTIDGQFNAIPTNTSLSALERLKVLMESNQTSNANAESSITAIDNYVDYLDGEFGIPDNRISITYHNEVPCVVQQDASSAASVSSLLRFKQPNAVLQLLFLFLAWLEVINHV